MDSSRREEVFAFVKSELEAGRQAYVVCPRIGDEAAVHEPAEDLFESPAQPGKRTVSSGSSAMAVSTPTSTA